MGETEAQHRPVGRPSTYTPEIVNEICIRLMKGEFLSHMCKEDHMPDITTVYQWMLDNPEFSSRYKRAREFQAHTLTDKVVEIGNDSSRDVIENEVSYTNKNGEVTTRTERRSDNTAVNRDKLRCDNLWRLAQVVNPAYNPKTSLEITGKDGTPLVAVIGDIAVTHKMDNNIKHIDTSTQLSIDVAPNNIKDIK